MKLNFGTVPFSYAGSYMAFSYPQDQAEGHERDLTLRILYGMFTDQQNFPIYLLDENEMPLEGTVEATEEELVLSNGKRKLWICFQNADVVWIKSNTKAGMCKRRLSGADRVMQHDYGVFEIAGYDDNLLFEVSRGSFRNDADWDVEGVGCTHLDVTFLPDEEGIFCCQMTLSGISYQRPEASDYEASLNQTKEIYRAFKSRFKTKLTEYEEAMEEAAYISWHSIVNPKGYAKYPIMLMTKNKMNQIWSWDYAINALAMADKDAGLAYGQFLAMAACQDAEGAYADCFQARTSVRGFVKPPVQGFLLRRMFAIHKPDKEVLKELYRTVGRFTDWWFTYRGRKDGIPEYHHGNDSGWDNSTVFKEGLPVKSPDLCAWLIDQMEFLADLAAELGYEVEGRRWKEQSSSLLQRMLDYFVVDDYFVAYKEPEHKIVKCDSLLLYIPLILGDRLPEKLRRKMLRDLLESKKFVTDYGIASEPTDSPYFVEDGYWRGAVWPPTALIMTELLMRNGQREAALKNARSFCDMCAKNGFFENYSALDGHGLRDSGFTWTASAFMILVRDYLEKAE